MYVCGGRGEWYGISVCGGGGGGVVRCMCEWEGEWYGVCVWGGGGVVRCMCVRGRGEWYGICVWGGSGTVYVCVGGVVRYMCVWGEWYGICVWGGSGTAYVCVWVCCVCRQNNDNVYFTSNFQYYGHLTRLALKVISGVHQLFKFPVIFVNVTRQTKWVQINFVAVVVVVVTHKFSSTRL